MPTENIPVTISNTPYTGRVFRNPDGSVTPLTTLSDEPERQLGRLTVPTFQEEKTEADLETIGGVQAVRFSAPVTVLDFYNGDTTTAIFTVNGLSFTLLPGAAYDATAFAGTLSDVVQVSGSSSFILKRFG